MSTSNINVTTSKIKQRDLMDRERLFFIRAFGELDCDVYLFLPDIFSMRFNLVFDHEISLVFTAELHWIYRVPEPTLLLILADILLLVVIFVSGM